MRRSLVSTSTLETRKLWLFSDCETINDSSTISLEVSSTFLTNQSHPETSFDSKVKLTSWPRILDRLSLSAFAGRLKWIRLLASKQISIPNRHAHQVATHDLRGTRAGETRGFSLPEGDGFSTFAPASLPSFLSFSCFPDTAPFRAAATRPTTVLVPATRNPFERWRPSGCLPYRRQQTWSNTRAQGQRTQRESRYRRTQNTGIHHSFSNS